MEEKSTQRMPLAEFLRLAAQRQATTVLYLVGSPPVMRIGRELQPPMENRPLTFHETEAMVEELLSPTEIQFMNEKGNVETTFNVGGVQGRLTVFYGLGCHNLVFYLDNCSSDQGKKQEATPDVPNSL
ncbi:MAG: hypothetical protein N2Z21_08995 [Candidatus Sumerlaeaceae bacterium]|nr:hypothetical protein [Candidatus Sumerlaeaceae bacterium]